MACERRVVAKKGAWPMLLDKLSGGLTSVEIVNKDRAWFPCSQKPQCEF
jgi:hypothetical protein